MNLNQGDRKWIDAMKQCARDFGGSDIIAVKSPNPRAPQPEVDAYKTLKAFMELYLGATSAAKRGDAT